MTVCIAAVCNNGERIVTATDGLVSMAGVTGEAIPGKMMWYGDWQFMYAGIPANFAMVCEEIRHSEVNGYDALSRANLLQTVRAAYQKTKSKLASFEILSPFDMTIEEFKSDGLSVFGEQYHTELSRQISQRGSLMDDQILVTGWGFAPHAALVYELSPSGEWMHDAAGFAAIGSGSQMAYTMLLLLGQARHRTLAETIFNVACAKFLSEKSAELDVGKWTSIYVARKRADADPTNKLSGEFVQTEDIEALRSIWEKHLKPRIPDEARLEIIRIGAKMNSGNITARDFAETVNATNRVRRERGWSKPEDELDPQSTTVDQSLQPPSPESPGGIDES